MNNAKSGWKAVDQALAGVGLPRTYMTGLGSWVAGPAVMGTEATLKVEMMLVRLISRYCAGVKRLVWNEDDRIGSTRWRCVLGSLTITNLASYFDVLKNVSMITMPSS